MTRNELEKLTPEQKRIKIAEACGWTGCDLETIPSEPVGIFEGQICELPDYLNDLNAMHEAVSLRIEGELRYQYCRNLYAVLEGDAPPVGNGHYCDLWIIERATAAQRAEAFLLIVG